MDRVDSHTSAWKNGEEEGSEENEQNGEDLREFISRAAQPGIGVYAARVFRTGTDFHFEVQLDGLNDPAGALSLDDCEAFSRNLTEFLDRFAADKSGIEFPESLRELSPENYTAEVSSAGVERELRLPEDLERFKGRPLKAVIRDGEGTRHKVIVVFAGMETELYLFENYTPRRKRARKGKRRTPEPIFDADGRTRVSAADLLKVNLYLDF